MQYNHHAPNSGTHKKPLKRILFGLITVITGLVLLLAWLDSRRQTVIDDSKNKGQVYEIVRYNQETKKFEEDLYTIELPADWQLYRRNENKLFKTNEYRSTKQFEDGKIMTVYIDSIPENFAIKLLLPVEVIGDKLVLRQMSSRCEEFTKGAENKISGGRAVDVVQAKWDNIAFTCENSAYRFVVGIGEPKSGKLGARFVSKDGTEHTIFMVYQDATGRPSEQTIIEAATSFRMKL